MPKSFSNNEPRSVIDPDADDYDEMIRKHRADVAAPEAGATAPVATSTTSDKRVANPVTEGLNFAREGRKKWENGQYVQAVGDAAEGIGNLIVTVDTLSGISKGGLKLKGTFVWRTKPWEEAGARKWLGEKGFLEPGQHGHHALIPNNGWGKAVPDWFKNQPFNIKGMESAAQHGRVHGRYKGAPQFNALERYWYGTPQWWKAMNASVLGSAIQRAPNLPHPKGVGDPARFPKGSL